MNMRYGNFMSDYDLFVSRKVAYVLSGGDCAEGTFVSEQEILDLEKEAFVSLMRREENARTHHVHADQGKAAA